MNYIIRVLGLEKPYTFYATCIDVANKVMNDCICKLPNNKIVMYQMIEKEIKEYNPKEKPILTCPKGHTGIDYKNLPIVRKSNNGKYICTLCGWREGEEL